VETNNYDLSSLKIDRGERNVNPERKGKIITTFITIIVVVAIIAGGYKGWKAMTDSSIEVNLTTAMVQSQAQTSAVLTASGYVVAQRKASVASKGTGRLIYLGVVEGDKVIKDQILAKIDNADMKAQLDQAKANLKLYQADLKDAQNNYTRIKNLFKSGSTTQMDVDAAEAKHNRVVANIEIAKAQIQSAEVAMENTIIRAPFNGTVLTKNADVGEVVAPLGAGANSKSAVVTMADMSSLQVEVDVSETSIEKVELNQECEIRLDAHPEKVYRGFIAKVVPTADRSKATVMVKVGFNNLDKSVLPEMSAKVNFLSAESKAVKDEYSKEYLVIPSNSVKNKKTVFVVRDGKAVEIPVTLGKDFGMYVEVKSGLAAGDKIIDSINDKITNGVKVSVK